MIINRLSVLLAERGIKASRVSSETGIARSTLNSIAKNSSKMIQLETINALCSYLKVEPKDFFLFTPFNLEFDFQLPVDKQIAYFVDNGMQGSEAAFDSFSGDLTLTFTKNYQKYDVIDLTFEVSGLTFEGYVPFDDMQELHIKVNDTKIHNFDNRWNAENLFPFYHEANMIALEAFLKKWTHNPDVKGVFKEGKLDGGNFDIQIDLPINPF